MKPLIKPIFVFILCALVSAAHAQKPEYETKKDLPYYATSVMDTNAYISERCKLDVYYPKKGKGVATIVWFHGGGLTEGSKSFPKALLEQGYCIVAPNYRLSPHVNAAFSIEDAAAAVAWVFKNIPTYGGDSTKIFLSGHSAGGYLDMMVGMNKKYLQQYGIDADGIAGLIPFSGHTITHFTIRQERGIPGTQPIVDALAPLFYVRKEAPPLLLITGDRELEMLGRYEENAYMMRMMKVAGHKETRLIEIKGYGHGMADPAYPMLLEEVKRVLKMN